MSVYAYRWPDGDVSFVQASDKLEAAAALDEMGPVELSLVKKMRRFSIHLRKDRETSEEEACFEMGTWDDLADFYPELAAQRAAGRAEEEQS